MMDVPAADATHSRRPKLRPLGADLDGDEQTIVIGCSVEKLLCLANQLRHLADMVARKTIRRQPMKTTKRKPERPLDRIERLIADGSAVVIYRSALPTCFNAVRITARDEHTAEKLDCLTSAYVSRDEEGHGTSVEEALDYLADLHLDE
jgi:hypothetical protein